MNLLFLSYTYWPPDFGGELLAAIERFKTLAKRGHQIIVLTSGRPGYSSVEHYDGIMVLRSPVVGNRRFARLLRRIVFWLWALYKLARMRYDVLHWLSMPGVGQASSALAAVSFGWLAHVRGARVFTVYSLADTETQSINVSGFQGFWKRVLLGTTDRIVAVSPALYGPLKQMFPSKTSMIIYGIRDDVFRVAQTDRDKIRSQFSITDDHVVFSFVGSVGWRKGFDVLAQAFAELADSYPNWRLWVIGPRTLVENQNINPQEVEDVCKPLNGLDSKVVYWGRINGRYKLAQIVAASDVFLFPSRREGMGIAPLEAMATGIPVIVARIPGITDLANQEGKTGLYVDPGNVQQLKNAMRQLGEDKFARDAMGMEAQKRIQNDFSWEHHVARWEDMYLRGE